MDIGLDVGIYGRLATPENVIGLARLAEEAGFASVWVADHVVMPARFDSRYPYREDGRFPLPVEEPVLEPIATMGVLVGETRRVRIGTAVLVLPYRNPVLLARMLATLDVFSGGRIVLGAGVGWLAEEFEALAAAPFAARGAVTDEYLEIFKRVCAGGEVEFDGRHYRLAPVFSNPPSIQRPHPPILIGGMSNAALRRVAAHGNGWLSVAFDPERIPERLAVLRSACEARGRDFGELELCHKLFISLDAPRRGFTGEREPGTGSAAQIAGDIRRLAELGFTSIVVRYLGEDAERQARQLRRFVDEVIPRI